MIDFKNVCFSYNNGAQTINDLTFHISKGEFVAIAGENGAGKSTTSKLMNGLLKPQKGTVTTAGFDTKRVKKCRICFCWIQKATHLPSAEEKDRRLPLPRFWRQSLKYFCLTSLQRGLTTDNVP